LFLWALIGRPYIYINLGLGGILLILCASTKSALFPFASWLPLAMAAPTPVSALVHSSTLVTAGIFIVLRAQSWGDFDPTLLTLLGLVTANIGGSARLIEFDIKKRVAYSTIRHCGVMIFGLGCGCGGLVFIHLVLHAFLKSILFILAGWSLVGFDGNQEGRLLGINKPNL